jgi:hypothetical protein
VGWPSAAGGFGRELVPALTTRGPTGSAGALVDALTTAEAAGIVGALVGRTAGFCSCGSDWTTLGAEITETLAGAAGCASSGTAITLGSGSDGIAASGLAGAVSTIGRRSAGPRLRTTGPGGATGCVSA